MKCSLELSRISKLVIGALSLTAFAVSATPPPPKNPVGAGIPATATLAPAGSATTVSGVEAKPGNILSIVVPTTTLTTDPKLAVQITGAGKTCQYHLVIINTDTNKETYFPQTSKFPALVHANLPLDQYAYGNYKVTAMAWGTDKSSGIACLGGGEYTKFNISRPKITAPADWPKITDVKLTAGKSATANTYRPDESIGFSVLGSVDNLDPKNADKRCGWTVLLEGNGQSAQLGKGTFFNMPGSASLAAFKPGTYTLKAHTTSGDDDLAKLPCLGSATKAITIIPVPGQIKGLKLEARGIHGNGKDFAKAIDNNVVGFFDPVIAIANAFIADNGILKITPIIEGSKCYYRLTQLINGGKAPFTGPFLHTPGTPDKFPAQVFSDDQTNIQVTIDAGDLEKQLGACEGSITKSITVRDDPKLPPVTM